ncbi:unnamed protein product, partial [Ectocarpus fasciculatus]
QVQWHASDEVNASMQHNNDPVVRSSLAKAGTVIANAITSPRKELNRLKEALNRPSGLQACHSTSPTVTASSADPSSMPGFFGSEGGFSPGGNNTFGGGGGGSGGGGSNFNTRASSPIYEIDLEADDNGGAAADSAAGRGLADGGASDGGTAMGCTTPRGSGRGRAGSASFGTTVEESDMSTPLRTRKAGRNMFAKAPGSSSRSRGGRGGGGSSHGATTPTSPSGKSTCTDRSGGGGGGGEGEEGGFSVLATAAAFAEVKVGVESPTGRAVRALAAAGGGSDKSAVADASVDSVVSDEDPPPGMQSLPAANHGETSRKPHDVSRAAAAAAVAAGAVAATTAYESRAKPDEEEHMGGVADPALSPRGAPPPAPFGGMLSGFGCMAPQLSPGKGAARLSPRAGSRLPQIDDDDSSLAEEEEENDEVGGRRTPGSSSPFSRSPLHSGPDGGSSEHVGQGGGSASAVSREKALALSRSCTMTPDLTPIAEMADNESFTDSEAGSDVSSCLSSMSGRSGYRVPRDPAALLAAAMEKAGQVAAIPPPSCGSHGRPLSSVQEVPMEGVPLPGLATPESGDECGLEVHSPWDSGSTTASTVSPSRAAAASTVEVDTTIVPIPSPAQRPEVSDDEEETEEEDDLAVPRAAGHERVFPSPARSRQEEEDEEEEHRAWEEAMQKQQTAAAMPGAVYDDDDNDIPALASPSPAAAAAGAAGQAAAAAAASGAAGSAQNESSVGEGAAKPPAFSLKSALSAFLGRKDSGVVAPADSVEEEEEEHEEVEEEEEEGEEEEVEEEEVVGTVTIDAADDSSPPDFARSPESHTLDMWPEAMSETRSKSSLDEGFVDVKISHMPMEDDDDTDDEAMMLQEPAQGPAADIPTLMIPTEEADTSLKPGQTPFSRAAMNLQSPGPDSPKALQEAPMPDLPAPPSPSMSRASMTMTLQTPTAVVNPRRISDASPMYDREAIARAMAQTDQEQDGDSDIVTASVAWPSERRINSYTDSSVSGMSEMTSSSCSGGDGGNGNKKTGHGC